MIKKADSSQLQIKAPKVKEKGEKGLKTHIQPSFNPVDSCSFKSTNVAKVKEAKISTKSEVPSTFFSKKVSETCSRASSSGTTTQSLAQKHTVLVETCHKQSQKTRVVVQCDVGFHNSLFLRGKGANLSWDKGIRLKNVKSDEWVWETENSFNTCEFKVLINDTQYEIGENHLIHWGTNTSYTPKF